MGDSDAMHLSISIYQKGIGLGSSLEEAQCIQIQHLTSHLDIVVPRCSLQINHNAVLLIKMVLLALWLASAGAPKALV